MAWKKYNELTQAEKDKKKARRTTSPAAEKAFRTYKKMDAKRTREDSYGRRY